jgi:hypothetical protein
MPEEAAAMLVAVKDGLELVFGGGVHHGKSAVININDSTISAACATNAVVPRTAPIWFIIPLRTALAARETNSRNPMTRTIAKEIRRWRANRQMAWLDFGTTPIPCRAKSELTEDAASTED